MTTKKLTRTSATDQFREGTFDRASLEKMTKEELVNQILRLVDQNNREQKIFETLQFGSEKIKAGATSPRNELKRNKVRKKKTAETVENKGSTVKEKKIVRTDGRKVGNKKSNNMYFMEKVKILYEEKKPNVDDKQERHVESKDVKVQQKLAKPSMQKMIKQKKDPVKVKTDI